MNNFIRIPILPACQDVYNGAQLKVVKSEFEVRLESFKEQYNNEIGKQNYNQALLLVCQINIAHFHKIRKLKGVS